MGFWSKLLGREKDGDSQAAVLDPEMEPGEGEDQDTQIEVKRVDVGTSKRSRQEMIEELEKNYKEVLDLVRRVKDHLERQDERTERFLRVADQVEAAMPAVQRLPEDVAAQTKQVGESVVNAIEKSEARRAEFGDRLEESLRGIGSHVARAEEIQQSLVSSVDGLSGSVTGVARSSAKASEALTAMNERAQQRDEQITDVIERTRKSMMIAVYIAISMGAIAVAVAAISIVQSMSAG